MLALAVVIASCRAPLSKNLTPERILESELWLPPHLRLAGITRVIEVDSGVDALGRCVFKPAALVESLRLVVQSHREMLFEKQGYVI